MESSEKLKYYIQWIGTARYGTNIFYVAVDGVAWPKTEIRITVTKLQLTHTPTFAMIVQILFKIARLHRHYNI